MTGSDYTARIHHVARERLDESLRRRSTAAGRRQCIGSSRSTATRSLTVGSTLEEAATKHGWGHGRTGAQSVHPGNSRKHVRTGENTSGGQDQREEMPARTRERIQRCCTMPPIATGNTATLKDISRLTERYGDHWCPVVGRLNGRRGYCCAHARDLCSRATETRYRLGHVVRTNVALLTLKRPASVRRAGNEQVEAKAFRQGARRQGTRASCCPRGRADSGEAAHQRTFSCVQLTRQHDGEQE
jgi:hypothetical protein